MHSEKPQIPANCSPRQLVEACGGFYKCPKDENGKRLGPLVGYSGRYEAKDSVRRQFVGEEYVDFAMVEQWPDLVLNHVVLPITAKLIDTIGHQPIVVCGVPEGGRTLATVLAVWKDTRYIFPEKVKIEGAAEGERSLEVLKFGRHTVHAKENVVIVEDVCNNFSNTLKLIEEVESAGGMVVAIVCFLNRSLTFREVYEVAGRSWPVIALWDQPMPQWRQDDPAVAEDIAAKNVVWKPKLQIADLQAIMARAA